MEFIDGPKTRSVIKELVASSDHCAMAVAFWGIDAIETLGLEMQGKRARIVCNLSSGASNPYEVDALRHLVRLRQCDTLNTAVYIFEEAAVIGSSNASANGLSLQGNELIGWTDYNVVIESTDHISKITSWFEGLWEISDRIDAEDIAVAKDTWSRRRRSLPRPMVPSSAGVDFLDVLMQSPHKWADRRALLYIHTIDPAQEADDWKCPEHLAYRSACKRDPFRYWAEIPDGSDLVTFSCIGGGRFEFEGFWEVPDGYSMLTQRTMQWRNNDVFSEYRVSERRWRAALTAVTKSTFWDDVGGYAIIDLFEFARRFVLNDSNRLF